MRKLSEINLNEGMWKSGLDRARSNEIRKEDYIDTNAKEIKEIDLGFDFVFADRLFVKEGEKTFTYNEIKEIEPYLKKYYGWRLPTTDDINNAFWDDKCEKIKNNITLFCKSKHAYNFEVYNKDLCENDNNVLHIDWQSWGKSKFIIEDHNENKKHDVTVWYFYRDYDINPQGGVDMGFGIAFDDDKYPVILIKDKKQ